MNLIKAGVKKRALLETEIKLLIDLLEHLSALLMGL